MNRQSQHPCDRECKAGSQCRFLDQDQCGSPSGDAQENELKGNPGDPKQERGSSNRSRCMKALKVKRRGNADDVCPRFGHYRKGDSFALPVSWYGPMKEPPIALCLGTWKEVERMRSCGWVGFGKAKAKTGRKTSALEEHLNRGRARERPGHLNGFIAGKVQVNFEHRKTRWNPLPIVGLECP